MEKSGQVPIPGSRQLNLKKSFRLGLQSLLTACSKEKFCRAFSSLNSAEQESLHRLYIQVIASLHQNIEDEFESLCLQTQVGSTLDTVEELVEEQTLNPLFPDKTNLWDIAHSLAMAKKKEIQHLTGMLEKAEEQNRIIKDRIELQRKERQDSSGASNIIEKMRAGILSYGAGNHGNLQ